MNLWGSIRKEAAGEVHRLRSQNPALRSARPSWWLPPIRLLLGRRSLFSLFGFYALLWCLVVAVGASVAFGVPPRLAPFTADLQRPDTIRTLLSYFLGAQATMVGLIFPLALGMVTLIVQRDEGAATNTDIQLYYHESLAYSVGTSGLTLAFALVVALPGPETAVLDLLGRAATAWSVSAALLLILGLWLLLNLIVTWHFLVTSLSFISPRFRSEARKRFVAGRVIPQHLAGILARYRNATLDDNLFPETRQDMPLVMTSFIDEIGGERCVSLHLRREKVLWDLRLRPLRWAVSIWAWRCRRQGLTPPKDRFEWMLVLAGPIDREMRGEVLLARRKGGVPLGRAERWLLRRAFVFAKPAKQEQVQPAEILEELADRVIVQIDRLAVTGFEHAVREMTDFHRFLLTSHTLIDEDGRARSLAAYGDLFAEHSSWVREYRRLFERAIGVLDRDDAFIGKLGFVTCELTPRPEARVPPAVVAGLYDLPHLMVHRIGHWLTAQRPVATPASTRKHGPLPPHLQRVYRSVALRLVGAHESALDAGVRYARAPEGADDATLWSCRTAVWPILFGHVTSCAYLLVASLWHEDEIGANLYLESFLGWRAELHDLGDPEYRYILRTDFLSQALVDRPWPDAAREAAPSLRDQRWEDATPPVLFSALMANLHADIRILTALTLAGWTKGEAIVAKAGVTAKRLATAIAPREGDVALDLVRTFIRLDVARWTADDDGGYQGSLDGLVRSLDAMTEKERVPGRVYSIDTRSHVSDVTPQWFALTASLCAEDSFDRISAWLGDLADDATWERLGDDTLWQLSEWLKRAATTWSDPGTRAELAASISALDPRLMVDAAGNGLAAALNAGAAAIHAHRTRRLVAMPVSKRVIEALEESAGQQLRALGARLEYFPGMPVTIIEGRKRRRSARLLGRDKRVVVDGPLKRHGDDIVDTAGDHIGRTAVSRIWRPYFDLPRLRIEVQSSVALFEAIAREGAALAAGGARPFVLMPGHGDRWPDLHEARREFREEIVKRDGGERSDFLYTFRGVDFYRSGLEHPELLAGDFLKQVTITAPDPGRPVQFSVEVAEDPTEVTIIGKYALEAEWSNRAVIRFTRQGRRPAA